MAVMTAGDVATGTFVGINSTLGTGLGTDGVGKTASTTVIMNMSSRVKILLLLLVTLSPTA